MFQKLIRARLGVPYGDRRQIAQMEVTEKANHRPFGSHCTRKSYSDPSMAMRSITPFVITALLPGQPFRDLGRLPSNQRFRQPDRGILRAYANDIGPQVRLDRDSAGKPPHGFTLLVYDRSST